jgi:hypothetical protein
MGGGMQVRQLRCTAQRFDLTAPLMTYQCGPSVDSSQRLQDLSGLHNNVLIRNDVLNLVHGVAVVCCMDTRVSPPKGSTLALQLWGLDNGIQL